MELHHLLAYLANTTNIFGFTSLKFNARIGQFHATSFGRQLFHTVTTGGLLASFTVYEFFHFDDIWPVDYRDRYSKIGNTCYFMDCSIYIVQLFFIMTMNLCRPYRYLKLFNRMLVVESKLKVHLCYRPNIKCMILLTKFKQLLLVLCYFGCNCTMVMIRGVMLNSWDMLEYSLAYSSMMVAVHMYSTLSSTIVSVITDRFGFVNQVIVSSATCVQSEKSIHELLIKCFQCLDELHAITEMFSACFGVCHMVFTLTVFCETTLQAYFLCQSLMHRD